MASNAKHSDIELSSSNKGWGDETSDQAQRIAYVRLEKVQSEIDRLDNLGSAEILKTNIKYNKLSQPLFQERTKLISKIPKFWATTLLGHPRIQGLLMEEDRDALHYLTSVNVIDCGDGYRIDFHFDQNPYFENQVLSTMFHQKKSDQKYMESTKITWKTEVVQAQCCGCPGNNELRKKRQRPRRGSIFSCFTGHGRATNEFWEIIKDDIWLNPLMYYISTSPEQTGLSPGNLPAEVEANDGERYDVDDGCGWSGL